MTTDIEIYSVRESGCLLDFLSIKFSEILELVDKPFDY